jgi:cytochrome c oxidase subunit 2
MGMRRLLAQAALASGASMMAASAWAADKVGQPTDGAIGFQPSASPPKYMAVNFHNDILLPITVGIVLFVLALLIYVVIRFNKRANPTPQKWSHNTLVEVAWTVVPVLILAFIAIFSFRLLFFYHDMPKPDLTVKVTGYQWYWGYSYPDNKVSEIISNMLPEEKTTPDLYRLKTDNPLVVPVNKVVKVLVTGSDVIHDFAMPAFGLKTDAIPGRVNQTWFKADRTGTFYGQCSELCGVNHAFMPIEIKVVSDADFAAYIAANHGVMPGAAAPAAATTVATAVTTPPAPAGAASSASGAATAPKSQ